MHLTKQDRAASRARCRVCPTLDSDAGGSSYLADETRLELRDWQNSMHRGPSGVDMLMWIVLGVVAWMIGIAFVLILMRVAGDEDRAARHEQKQLDPFSDVTITRPGIG